MKNFIYLLGLGVVGIIAYNIFLKKDNETIIEDPQTNYDLQTQPQQRYPIQMTETPRVDNADQPWYGGARSFMGETQEASAGLSMTVEDYFMSYSPNTMWSDLAKTYMN